MAPGGRRIIKFYNFRGERKEEREETSRLVVLMV